MSGQTQLLIDAGEVEKAFVACLWTDEEVKVAPKDANGAPKCTIFAQGIQRKFGFHPGRVEEQRDKVTEWLRALPHTFRKSGGGGWSFLNACNQENGEQWTGLHLRMDQLFVLGTALGLVESQFPREIWSALPGGMPYYVINVE